MTSVQGGSPFKRVSHESPVSQRHPVLRPCSSALGPACRGCLALRLCCAPRQPLGTVEGSLHSAIVRLVPARCWALASLSEDTVRAHQWEEAQHAGLGPGFIQALPQPILVSTTGRASLRSPQGLAPWGAPLLPGLPPSKQAPFKCLLHTVPMTLFHPRKASLIHGIGR